MSVIVFTTIFGASDSLKPAPVGADRAVCFTDVPHADANGWEMVLHHHAGDPRRMAWHLRCVPHQLFDGYDRVIWIDASFTLTNLPLLLRDTGKADIAALRHHARSSCVDEAREIAKVGQAPAVELIRQVDGYLAEGFSGRPLSISCVIVRARTAAVQRFNETWAAQIEQFPADNTQLSLDYSAWKSGLAIAPLHGTRHQNPYATHDHADHKKRRKPYATAVPR